MGKNTFMRLIWLPPAHQNAVKFGLSLLGNASSIASTTISEKSNGEVVGFRLATFLNFQWRKNKKTFQRSENNYVSLVTCRTSPCSFMILPEYTDTNARFVGACSFSAAPRAIRFTTAEFFLFTPAAPRIYKRRCCRAQPTLPTLPPFFLAALLHA